jgi:hypothetical protein
MLKEICDISSLDMENDFLKGNNTLLLEEFVLFTTPSEILHNSHYDTLCA